MSETSLASTFIENFLIFTRISRIPWVPISLIIVIYLLKAYIIYIDVRRCHCFPITPQDTLRFASAYTFILPLNVLVMHLFPSPRRWSYLFLANFVGNYIMAYSEFLPLSDSDAPYLKEAGTIYGIHCPNQVKLKDQDLKALRKQHIQVLRYVNLRSPQEIVDIGLYDFPEEDIVMPQNIPNSNLFISLPLRGAPKPPTYVDPSRTEIAYRFLFGNIPPA